MNGYGAPMIYGVPANTWNSWSAHTQQLWLQDYNRTDAQATYYQDQTFLYDVAYTYTGVVDAVLGTEAVETGEFVNETIEDIKEKAGDVLDTGKDITLIALGLGALILLTRK